MNPTDLYPYQRRAGVHLTSLRFAMLWLDIGLGKTVVAETALADLMDRGLICSALVLATKRIVETVWRQEAKKWSHLSGLTFSLVRGTKAERAYALRRPAQIYLTNYENLVWLTNEVIAGWLSKHRYPPFQAVVYDEITKMKSPGTHRVKAFTRLLPWIPWRWGLTGEPAANGYGDLFGQYLVLDGGARLGQTQTAFRSAFYSGDYISSIGRQQIHKRISDITLEMRAEDYLDLPPVKVNDIPVVLPPDARAVYDEMEQEFFADLPSGIRVESPTAAAKGVRCLQIANGAIYETAGSHRWEGLHEAKLDALEDLLDEHGGKPVLLAYAFQSDRERIVERFPQAEVLSSKLPERQAQSLVDRWNRGEVPLLVGHPASMGHGLNLQWGGSTIVWFGLNWSLDLYHQLNGRLTGGHRRQSTVIIHRILAEDTLDEAVRAALSAKAGVQHALRNAIKAYQERRSG